MIEYIDTMFGAMILIAIWVAHNSHIYAKVRYEKEKKENKTKIKSYTTNKERIFELEQVLFFVTDILHDEQKRKLFTQDEISYIITNARLFTRYGRRSIEALEDNPTLIKRDEEFIQYLKNDIWIKIYGRAFDTFQDIKDNL